MKGDSSPYTRKKIIMGDKSDNSLNRSDNSINTSHMKNSMMNNQEINDTKNIIEDDLETYIPKGKKLSFGIGYMDPSIVSKYFNMSNGLDKVNDLPVKENKVNRTKSSDNQPKAVHFINDTLNEKEKDKEKGKKSFQNNFLDEFNNRKNKFDTSTNPYDLPRSKGTSTSPIRTNNINNNNNSLKTDTSNKNLNNNNKEQHLNKFIEMQASGYFRDVSQDNHHHRNRSNAPFEKLKEKLDGDFVSFLNKHRFSAIMIGNSKYDGKNGDYYLNNKKMNENSKIEEKEVNMNTNIATTNLNLTRGPSGNSNYFNSSNQSIGEILEKKVNITKKVTPLSNTPDKNYINSQRNARKDLTPTRTISSQATINKITENNNITNTGSKNAIHDKKLIMPNNKTISKKIINTSNKQLENRNHVKNIEKLIGLSKRQVDLTPIPSKRKMKNQLDVEEYKQAERAAVLIRRIEYSEKMKNVEKNSENLYLELIIEAKAIILQRWWKRLEPKRLYRLLKIIQIQSVFRGYLGRTAFKQVYNLIKYTFPFISQLSYVVNKRHMKNYFKILYKRYAVLSRSNYIIKKINLIKRGLRGFIKRKKAKIHKIKRMIYLIGKTTFINSLDSLKQHHKSMDKVIKIQGLARRINARNEVLNSIDLHPRLYYYLKYSRNKPLLDKKKEYFQNIVKRIKYLMQRKKLNELIEKTENYRKIKCETKYFYDFKKRLFNYRLVKMKIKMIGRQIKDLLPIFNRTYKRLAFAEWKKKYWLVRNHCLLGKRLISMAYKSHLWKQFKKNIIVSGLNNKSKEKIKKLILVKYRFSYIKYFKKWKGYRVKCLKRESKIKQFVLRKDILSKNLALRKIKQICYYKADKYAGSMNIHKAVTGLQQLMLKKYIQYYAKNNKNNLTRLLKKSKLHFKIKKIFKYAILKNEKNLKVYLNKFREKKTGLVNLERSKKTKLKRVVSGYLKNIKLIQKMRFKAFFNQVYKLKHNDEINKLQYENNINEGMQKISNIRKTKLKKVFTNILRMSIHKHNAKTFSMNLFNKMNKQIHVCKNQIFGKLIYNSSKLYEKKKNKNNLVSRLILKKIIDENSSILKYFKRWVYYKQLYTSITQARFKTMANKIKTFNQNKNMENKNENKSELLKIKNKTLSKLILESTKYTENVLLKHLIRWKYIVIKDLINKSAAVIVKYSNNALNKIKKDKLNTLLRKKYTKTIIQEVINISKLCRKRHVISIYFHQKFICKSYYMSLFNKMSMYNRITLLRNSIKKADGNKMTKQMKMLLKRWRVINILTKQKASQIQKKYKHSLKMKRLKQEIKRIAVLSRLYERYENKDKADLKCYFGVYKKQCNLVYMNRCTKTIQIIFRNRTKQKERDRRRKIIKTCVKNLIMKVENRIKLMFTLWKRINIIEKMSKNVIRIQKNWKFFNVYHKIKHVTMNKVVDVNQTKTELDKDILTTLKTEKLTNILDRLYRGCISDCFKKLTPDRKVNQQVSYNQRLSMSIIRYNLCDIIRMNIGNAVFDKIKEYISLMPKKEECVNKNTEITKITQEGQNSNTNINTNTEIAKIIQEEPNSNTNIEVIKNFQEVNNTIINDLNLKETLLLNRSNLLQDIFIKKDLKMKLILLQSFIRNRINTKYLKLIEKSNNIQKYYRFKNNYMRNITLFRNKLKLRKLMRKSIIKDIQKTFKIVKFLKLIYIARNARKFLTSTKKLSLYNKYNFFIKPFYIFTSRYLRLLYSNVKEKSNAVFIQTYWRNRVKLSIRKRINETLTDYVLHRDLNRKKVMQQFFSNWLKLTFLIKIEKSIGVITKFIYHIVITKRMKTIIYTCCKRKILKNLGYVLKMIKSNK